MSLPRLIFAGSGAFGLPTLAAIKEHVVQVISQPDRPAGRGRKLAPTPIAQFALENNIPLLRTENINHEALPAADAMVVIAFGQKIAPEKVNHPRLGSINLHASLLPKHRGAAPIVWTILKGDAIAGNSVIRLAERMDAGAILGQFPLTIGETETSGELHDRLAIAGVELIQNVLAELAANRANERPQDEAMASGAPKLSRRDAMLDWSHSAEELSRRIRGLFPWPGCRVAMTDAAKNEVARLTLVRAQAVEGEGCRWNDGEIETTGHICVNGGKGAIEILEVHPEGSRPMTLADFRRGHAWMAGMRLVSIS